MDEILANEEIRNLSQLWEQDLVQSLCWQELDTKNWLLWPDAVSMELIRTLLITLILSLYETCF